MNRLIKVMFVFLMVLTIPMASAEWTWMNPTPTGNNINAIFYRTADDIIFAGTGGTIMEWDGQDFDVSTICWEEDLNGIVEVPGKGLVAVGTHGTIMTWNEGSWTQDPVPTSSTINSIWAGSDGSAFACTSWNKILQWDGDQWNEHELTLYPEEVILLIWGISGTQVYVISSEGRLYMWNGVEWILHSNMYRSSYTDLCGSETGELYIASQYIKYYDGTQWANITPEETYWFEDLNVLPSGDLLAIQRNGSIYKWDHSTWTKLLSLDLEDDVCVAWLQDESEAYFATETGTLYYWNGEDPVKIHPQDALTNADLMDVWSISENDVYAVGSDSTVLHWTGLDWQVIPVEIPNADFLSVWAADSENVYIAGNTTENPTGIVLRGHGTTWEVLPDYPSSSWLHDLWGFGVDDLVVANSYGGSYHWDGTVWSQYNTEGFFGAYFPTIWGRSSDDFYLAGYQEHGGPGHTNLEAWLYHWNGSQFETVFHGYASNYRGLWGDEDNNVYLGGENSIYHFDGIETHKIFESQSLGTVQGIFGFDSNTVFAVGNGNIFSWDGLCWRQRREPCGNTLNAIGGTDVDHMYAVGDNGLILQGNSEVSAGVEIAMPVQATSFEDFYVMGYLNNPGETLTGVHVYFILDVYGDLFFWDDWTRYHPPDHTEMDYVIMDVPGGTTPVEVVPRMDWPEIDQHADGLYFYGGMVDPVTGILIGDYAVTRWAY